MAKTEKARYIIAGTANGLPIMDQIEQFTPPKIEKDMQTVRGGRFAADKIMTGLKELGATLQLNGPEMLIKKSLGVAAGDGFLLDVRESGRDKDGGTWSTWYLLAGEIESIEEDNVKMGELPRTTIVMSVYRYQTFENGVPVININTRTQVMDLGGGDLLADARRAVLLP